MNELANLSEAIGADVAEVQRGIGADPRIGKEYLQPGMGYGGSCLPKDVASLISVGEVAGVTMGVARAVAEVNSVQAHRITEKLERHLGDLAGRTVAVWGIAFKSGTDDMRDAPSHILIQDLVDAGAKVQAFDPAAGDAARRHYAAEKDVTVVGTAAEATRGADALVIAADWPEFRSAPVRELANILGWLLVQRMLRPVLRLSEHLGRAADGRLDPIPEAELPPADTEAGRAFRRYNAAATAIAEREALLNRLAEEERRALVGRYASAMAHEVNNPLGGLFNAVRMIQRHGDDPERRLRAASLLERGLTGIHNIVRASLILWRGEADTRPVSVADIDDLRLLIESEARRRDVILDWHQTMEGSFPAPAQAVRQIALNLLLNACAASPPGGRITVRADAADGLLTLFVGDEGPGLPAEARRLLLDGQTEQVPQAGGLGLWTVVRLVRELNAELQLADPPGTHISIRIPDDERRTHRLARCASLHLSPPLPTRSRAPRRAGSPAASALLALEPELAPFFALSVGGRPPRAGPFLHLPRRVQAAALALLGCLPGLSASTLRAVALCALSPSAEPGVPALAADAVACAPGAVLPLRLGWMGTLMLGQDASGAQGVTLPPPRGFKGKGKR